jgi:hypothetical protein
MSRYRSSLNEEEKVLLNEMAKLCTWVGTNARKPSSISLRKNQFTIFRRLCGRLQEHAICDVNHVQRVDAKNRAFDGIPVRMLGERA